MKLISLTKTRLANGLPVYLGLTPESASFEITMHIDTGSRDEAPERNGESHFLEHMMFRGSRSYPDSIKLAHALEAFGGENNAMTSVESTVYWLRGAARAYDRATDAFAEFFLHPNFADLETERSIILQELQGDYNEDGDLVDPESLAMEGLFGDHPLGMPIIGREEVIKRLGEADLRAKRARFYTPSHCALSVVSSLPPEKLIPVVERAFGHTWDHAPSASPPATNAGASLADRHALAEARRFIASPRDFFAPPPGRARRHVLKLTNNSDSQYAVKLIFPGAGGLTREVVAETFLQRILDDGISSRLPAEIRERQGLVYDISCVSTAFADVGAFSVDATVSKDSIDKLLARLFEELDRIVQDKPTPEEMDRIRFRYQFDLETLAESHGRLVSREVWNGFLPRSLTIDEERAIVETLTAEEILDTAQRVIGAPKRALVLIGPRARKKRDDVEKFMERLASG
jgi:predicted Zn-dependent peptidase